MFSHGWMACPDSGLQFVVKMALRKALKLARGLRKQISDTEEDVMAAKLIEEINLSAYESHGAGHGRQIHRILPGFHRASGRELSAGCQFRK
jgi:hypothetical protein